METNTNEYEEVIPRALLGDRMAESSARMDNMTSDQDGYDQESKNFVDSYKLYLDEEKLEIEREKLAFEQDKDRHERERNAEKEQYEREQNEKKEKQEKIFRYVDLAMKGIYGLGMGMISLNLFHTETESYNRYKETFRVTFQEFGNIFKGRTKKH